MEIEFKYFKRNTKDGENQAIVICYTVGKSRKCFMIIYANTVVWTY